MAGFDAPAGSSGPAQGLMGGGGAPDAINPSEAMRRLMSTPMTTEQQRAVIQQYAPHAVQDFDRMHSMFQQFFPPQQGQAEEPSILGYDLEPPEDAPRPLAAQVMKFRKMLMSPPQQPQRMPMRGPVNPLMRAGEAQPAPRMPVNPLAMR